VLDFKLILPNFRYFRNELLLSFYIKQKTPKFYDFMESIKTLKNSNVAVVVAFEQPWALNWLLKMAKKNLKKTSILVFDNSRKLALRQKIELVCKENEVFYYSLPEYRTHHVNRSHGMALSWIYTNVIKTLQPKIFAFIDHDLIPVNSIDFFKIINSQPFYGRVTGNKPGFWSLWAGYCLFDFNYLADKKINFLYDFTKGLDTGGRNWDSLYSNFKKNQLAFAPSTIRTIFLPKFKKGMSVSFIDNKWIHIGGISYNNNFDKKFNFFKALAKELDLDQDWTKLLKK
jgi:hypothetical protein